MITCSFKLQDLSAVGTTDFVPWGFNPTQNNMGFQIHEERTCSHKLQDIVP